MRPPRLAIAPDQHLVGGVDEEHLDLVAPLPERGERLVGAFQERAGADVHPEPNPLDLARPRRQLHQIQRERRREVVDAVEAEILEYMERGRATGPAHSGDDDDV